jgi:radical SAM protein with 4Fe4S-binding SPASM domain
MRTAERRYRDEWLPNFYPSRPANGKLVRVSRHGRSVLLTEDEDAQLNEFFMDASLFNRLERTGHVVTAENAQRVMGELKTWLTGTYDGPGLHIVVPTRRCNLDCPYCHMNPQPVGANRLVTDLQPETIPHLARFILSSPKPSLHVEFQGGEPFLAFPLIVQTFEEINRQNASIGKAIRFDIVTNLMVAKDHELEYCLANDIKLSYTLNGPQPVHDIFRITSNGHGSHDVVIRKIEHISKKFPGLLTSSPLCVVTADTVKYMRQTVEYFHQLGFRDIGTIVLKNLGSAARRGIPFTMRDYIPHYLSLLDFICEKNRTSGDSYSERTARLALLKILSPTNPLFVDWRNPIGYVSNVLVYDTDGEILPVDEARSLRDVFKLGNVRDFKSYEDLVSKREVFATTNLSLRDRDPVCRECAYNPYCGVSPVLHYSKTGKMAPEPHVSDECVLIIALFDWLFKKLQEDPAPVMKMISGLVPKPAVASAAAVTQ